MSPGPVDLLEVLPAGTYGDASVPELIAQRFAAVMDSAATEFDNVVVIGPPLDVCDDSRAMAVDSSIVLALVEGSVSASALRAARRPDPGRGCAAARRRARRRSSPSGRRLMAGRDQQIQTNRRLHVLHVSVPTSGGVATVATRYVRDQVERGWNVTVACPSRGDLGYAAREAGATVRWWRADAAREHPARRGGSG